DYRYRPGGSLSGDCRRCSPYDNEINSKPNKFISQFRETFCLTIGETIFNFISLPSNVTKFPQTSSECFKLCGVERWCYGLQHSNSIRFYRLLRLCSERPYRGGTDKRDEIATLQCRLLGSGLRHRTGSSQH